LEKFINKGRIQYTEAEERHEGGEVESPQNEEISSLIQAWTGGLIRMTLSFGGSKKRLGEGRRRSKPSEISRLLRGFMGKSVFFNIDTKSERQPGAEEGGRRQDWEGLGTLQRCRSDRPKDLIFGGQGGRKKESRKKKLLALKTKGRGISWTRPGTGKKRDKGRQKGGLGKEGLATRMGG